MPSIFVMLVEYVAAFRMTNQRILYETAQLMGRYFACESSFVAPIKVLSGKFELSVIYLQRNWLKSQMTRRQDYLDTLVYLYKIGQLMHIQTRLMDGEVHLPVTDDKFFAHR